MKKKEGMRKVRNEGRKERSKKEKEKEREKEEKNVVILFDHPSQSSPLIG